MSGKTITSKAVKIAVIVLSVVVIAAIGFWSMQPKKTVESPPVEAPEEPPIPLENYSENSLFKEYIARGIFLKGEVPLLDSDINRIGKLEIDKITPVQILEKSSEMYYSPDSQIECERAYLLKVKYQDSDYIVFGRDIYKIDDTKIFSVVNKNEEKLVLFPIKNFKIGAFNDAGLTGCEDYSLLALQNETKNKYSLIKYPENADITPPPEYAFLASDDGANEEIYKVSIKQDILIIGIKAIYQEGGSVYNLVVELSGDSLKTKISNRIDFEEADAEKMDEYFSTFR